MLRRSAQPSTVLVQRGPLAAVGSFNVASVRDITRRWLHNTKREGQYTYELQLKHNTPTGGSLIRSRVLVMMYKGCQALFTSLHVVQIRLYRS